MGGGCCTLGSDLMTPDWQRWDDHPARKQWEVLKDLGHGSFAEVRRAVRGVQHPPAQTPPGPPPLPPAPIPRLPARPPQVVLARNRQTGELAALKVVHLDSPAVDAEHCEVRGGVGGARWWAWVWVRACARSCTRQQGARTRTRAPALVCLTSHPHTHPPPPPPTHTRLPGDGARAPAAHHAGPPPHRRVPRRHPLTQADCAGARVAEVGVAGWLGVVGWVGGWLSGWIGVV